MLAYCYYIEQKILVPDGPIEQHYSDQYYKDRESAEKALQERLLNPYVEVLKHEIIEVDIPDTLQFLGIVTYDGEYEDYHIVLNGDDDELIDFTDKIRDHYLGRKVEITVKVLD